MLILQLFVQLSDHVLTGDADISKCQVLEVGFFGPINFGQCSGISSEQFGESFRYCVQVHHHPFPSLAFKESKVKVEINSN